MPPFLCENCQQVIPFGSHPYTVKVEMFPRVEESLDISLSELEADHIGEMQKIIDQLEAMTDDEVRLENERVYSVFKFVICPACRDRLARLMRRRDKAES